MPTRRGWSVLALAVALVVGLMVAMRPVETQAAPPAPDFTLPAASGAHGTISLHALRGHAVLLNFFLSNCGPCLDELPVLRAAARRYRADGVTVLGVASLGDNAAAVRRLGAGLHLGYPLALDTQQAVAWRYGVSGVPVSFFIDAQGHLRGQVAGPLDPQTLRAGLAQAGAIACGSCSKVAPPTLVTGDAPATSAARLDADTLFTNNWRAPRFALRDQTGHVVSPDSLRGKVVALTFMSALCREQCPLVGQALGQVRRSLGRDGRKMAIVAISVNPEVDTPRATQAFASESGWTGTEWHYLTAPRSVLSRIWASYYIYVAPPSPIFKPSAQSPVHQAELYLIDPRGRVRAYYDVPMLTSRVTSTIRALIAGQ